MKYLKGLYESSIPKGKYKVDNGLIEDIKDVLLDLEDNGFLTDVEESQYVDMVNIEINKENWNAPFGIMASEFKVSEVSDYIDRIEDLIKQNGYTINSIWASMFKKWFDITEYKEMLDKRVNTIKLQFAVVSKDPKLLKTYNESNDRLNMKYLKTYNESTKPYLELVDDIKDILLEIYDFKQYRVGYKTKFNTQNPDGVRMASISYTGIVNDKLDPRISESRERLCDYLKLNGYEVTIKTSNIYSPRMKIITKGDLYEMDINIGDSIKIYAK